MSNHVFEAIFRCASDFLLGRFALHAASHAVVAVGLTYLDTLSGHMSGGTLRSFQWQPHFSPPSTDIDVTMRMDVVTFGLYILRQNQSTFWHSDDPVMRVSRSVPHV